MYFEYEDELIDYCMQMAMFMKGILWMVNSMAKENLHGQMAMYMKEILWMVSAQAKEK